MTIWWSKATRLLEFSRSRLQSKFAPRHEEEVGPGFFVTEEEDRGGIGYSSSWKCKLFEEGISWNHFRSGGENVHKLDFQLAWFYIWQKRQHRWWDEQACLHQCVGESNVQLFIFDLKEDHGSWKQGFSIRRYKAQKILIQIPKMNNIKWMFCVECITMTFL